MLNQTKIIAGNLKGRKLRLPQNETVRPTKSMVRGALFSILGDFVVGSTMVDCFAGTGSVGFESLSRGAKKVLFFEKDHECFVQIQKKVEEFCLQDKAEVFYGDTLSILGRKEFVEHQFDWIYLDPPYGSKLSKEVAMLCVKRKLFVEGGMIVSEEQSKEKIWETEEDIKIWKNRVYGSTRLDFYKIEKI